MNERFLFRGRRYDNGEWITGWITSQFKKFTEGEVLTYIKSNVFGGGEHLVNTKTVGQCTGLKDKNGKLIFEGDIVEDGDSGLFGKVIFATAADGFDGMTGFMVDDVDDGIQNYNGFWHSVEVIGNVYDGLELSLPSYRKGVR